MSKHEADVSQSLKMLLLQGLQEPSNVAFKYVACSHKDIMLRLIKCVIFL